MLSPAHVTMLRQESGITDAVITARGYRSIDDPGDLQDLGFSKAQARTAPALAIPIWNVHRQQGSWVIRPDSPRQLKNGKVCKYENRKGGHLILDVHPSVQPLVANPAVPLWITEGVKKGDALVSHGACAIALMGGVWGFRGRNEHGGEVILPDWQHVALNDRLVYVAFDSDLATKRGVQAALNALYEFLRTKGAIPALLQWPEEYRQKKWGVDDFLAQGHTLDDLLAMIPKPGPLPARLTRRAGGGASLPQIEVTTNIKAVVDATEAAILAMANSPHLFQRARELVCISKQAPALKWLRRPADMPVIIKATPEHVRELASMAAIWSKFDKRSGELEPALPPEWMAKMLRDREGWLFPVLEGIVSTPTLLPDGSLLERQGYDKETGLFVAYEVKYRAVKPNPTKKEALRALKILKAPFVDFLFDYTSPANLSAAIAAILTVLCRYAIQGDVPLFAVTATSPRSGKGLLVDVISIITTGRTAPRWAQPRDRDGDEERKRMLAVGQAGTPLVLIDNLTRPLGSEALDIALTCQGAYSDRVMGTHETKEVPMHTVFFATGNNLTYKADTAPRCVPIALDPNMERPEERDDFKHKTLRKWVRKHRPTFVHAALTLMRAYFAAGAPKDESMKPLGGFEEWSNLIRQVLIWADEVDPLKGQPTFAIAQDTGRDTLLELLNAWETCYPDKAVTLKQVKQDIGLYGARHDQPANNWNILSDAMSAFDARGSSGDLNTESIAQHFRSLRGRVVNGKRLEQGKTRTKYGHEWHVIAVDHKGDGCRGVVGVAVSPVTREIGRKNGPDDGIDNAEISDNHRGDGGNSYTGYTSTPAPPGESRGTCPDGQPHNYLKGGDGLCTRCNAPKP
jgi:hypothetical protein